MDTTIIAMPLLIGLVALALAFDFLNGLHDAANSIATVVSTRLLKPVHAVLFAAFFNFSAYFVFGLAVAETIGKGIIDKDIVNPQVIFGALMGAMFWNVLTWVKGIPSSSSHALIGGLVGAGVTRAGFEGVVWSGVAKTASAIVLSPTIGLLVSMLIMLVTSWGFVRASAQTAEGAFKKLHLLSSAAYSLGHGANDAQKTMGIITGVLVTGGYLQTFEVPFWVVISAHIAIGLGTLSGGWRIVKTMGTKITKLAPVGGFAAETGAAVAILIATLLGVGISTTHTITGSIVGVGATRRLSAVRWGVAGRIVWAWVMTIPAAAAVGAGTYGLLVLLGAR